MKTRIIFFLFTAFIAIGKLAAQRISVDQGENWIDFSQASKENYIRNLYNETTLLLQGTWNNIQLEGLRKALNPDNRGTGGALREIDMTHIVCEGDSLSAFRSLFYRCEDLVTVLLPTHEYTGKVDLSNTFTGCSDLQTLKNLENMINITSFSSTFAECGRLTEITLPEGTLSSGIDFSAAFMDCYSLQSITNLLLFPSVTDFSFTFKGCSSLTELFLPLSSSYPGISFDNTFRDCQNLSQIYHLETFHSVSSFSQTFAGCSSLKKIVLPDLVDRDHYELDFDQTFQACDSLFTVYNLQRYTNIKNLNHTFEGCGRLAFLYLPRLSDEVYENAASVFENINPNCILYFPDDTYIDDTWRNVVIDDIAYTPIEFYPDHPFFIDRSIRLDYSGGARFITDPDNFFTGTTPVATLWLPFNAILSIDGVPYEAAPTAADERTHLYSVMTYADHRGQYLDFVFHPFIAAYVPYILKINEVMAANEWVGWETMIFESTGDLLEASPRPLPEMLDIVETSDGYGIDLLFFEGVGEEELFEIGYVLDPDMSEEYITFRLDREGVIPPFQAYMVSYYSDYIYENIYAVPIRERGADLMYPENPDHIEDKIYTSRGGLFIDSNKARLIHVYGLEGNLVKTQMIGEGVTQIDGLRSGMYLIEGKRTIVY